MTKYFDIDIDSNDIKWNFNHNGIDKIFTISTNYINEIGDITIVDNRVYAVVDNYHIYPFEFKIPSYLLWIDMGFENRTDFLKEMYRKFRYDDMTDLYVFELKLIYDENSDKGEIKNGN